MSYRTRFTNRDLTTLLWPSYFHTDNKEVWDFVNSYSEFYPFINRVKAVTEAGVFSLPINLLTINQLFGKTFNPKQAKDFIHSLSQSFDDKAKNMEEQALSLLGDKIYKTFFKGYTEKQWGVGQQSYLPLFLKGFLFALIMMIITISIVIKVCLRRAILI